jgi:hypothetical protein
MPTSKILRRVALARIDVSEECIATIIWVTVFLRTVLLTLVIEAKRSSETSTLTRAKWRNILEDVFLQNIN